MQKHILVITDTPTEAEEERNMPYSSPMNQKMLEALRKTSLELSIPSVKVLHYKNIECMYLSNSRPDKEDPDWLKSIVAKVNIPEGQVQDYVEVSWLKNVWVTTTLMTCINDVIAKIEEVNPSIIICGGKWSFLILTGLTTISQTKSVGNKKQIFGGLAKYRGSSIVNADLLGQRIIFPIYTPKDFWAIKDKEQVVKGDYKKIVTLYKKILEGATINELTKEPDLKIPTNNIHIIGLLKHLYQCLCAGELLVSTDVETMNGAIDCIGFCWDSEFTLTIPFTKLVISTLTETTTILKKDAKSKNSYKEMVAEAGTVVAIQVSVFSVDDEAEIMYWLGKCMLHKNYLHVGQNYSYDCQYYHRNWKMLIFPYHDTMILHHQLYNYMEKNLAFLASMYVDGYLYWKDELDIKITKNELGIFTADNESRWVYNGKDNYYTLKILQELLENHLPKRDPALAEFYRLQMDDISPMYLCMMNKGIRCNVVKKNEFLGIFENLLWKMEGMFEEILEQPINLKSSDQVKALFKDFLGVVPLIDPKTKSETFGTKALLVYIETYPMIAPLFELLREYKSTGVFVRNFLRARLDVDNRIRTFYHIAKTDTGRAASTKNAFGTGLNIQNIPAKGKILLKYALQDLFSDIEEED